jgi:hypothetical protein
LIASRGACTVIRHVEIEDLGYLGEALEQAEEKPLRW